MTGQQQFQPRARLTDPPTSHQAAATVTYPSKSKEAIYSFIANYGPVSDEQVKALMDRAGIAISDSGCRTRRSELVREGLVTDSGKRGKTGSGRATILWTVTP